MSEVIERVVRAIETEMQRVHDSSGGILCASPEQLARAAIAALREPTEAMLEAGLEAHYDPDDWRIRELGTTWRAMIDAALVEP